MLIDKIMIVTSMISLIMFFWQEFTELASSRKTSMALSTFSSQVFFISSSFLWSFFNRAIIFKIIIIQSLFGVFCLFWVFFFQYSEPPDVLIKQDWERDPWEFPRWSPRSSWMPACHHQHADKIVKQNHFYSFENHVHVRHHLKFFGILGEGCFGQVRTMLMEKLSVGKHYANVVSLWWWWS